MLPTPSTSHVDYNQIYEPAEDSFLLLDTLSSKQEIEFLRERFPKNSPTPLVVEVGVGSGVVLAFVTAHAQQILSRSDIATLGTDVNLLACVASRKTVAIAARESHTQNITPGSFLGILTGDLATAIRPGAVDVLIFNPPYVPSEDLPSIPAEQVPGAQDCTTPFVFDSGLLALSTDGGVDGMETTRRLLADLDSVLSLRGIAYILLCAQNKPDEVMHEIRNSMSSLHGNSSSWHVEKVSSSGQQAGWERLCIIRIWRELVSH